jgi:hypothetical protein
LSGGRALLAVLLGVTAAVFISGYWLADFFPPDSTLLVVAAAVLAVTAVFPYYLLLGMLRRRLPELNLWNVMAALFLSVVLSCFLLFAGTSSWQSRDKYVPFLLPRHEFRLEAIDATEGTALTWLSTSLGDISYGTVAMDGWIRRGEHLILQNPDSNGLEWTAVTGERLLFVLESRQPGGQARLTWEDGEELIALDSRTTNYELKFAIPTYASRGLVLLLGVLSLSVLSLWVVVGAWRTRGAWLFKESPAVAQPTVGLERSDILIVGLAMLVALALRVFNLDRLFPAVDEYYHLIAADQILQGAPLESVYPRGLWIVTMPVALALRVFGHELWAARLIGALFNVLGIIPLYLLMRKVSRRAAALTCVLYATSPWIITFGRVAREYAYYPFIFYWIVYAMVQLVGAIPNRLVVPREWGSLLRARFLLPAACLILPPIFALKIDWLSTFRTILIAYLVLGVFVLTRLDWRAKANWPFLLAVLAALAIGGVAWYREQATKLLPVPRVNPVPLAYFFPNPEQQWYFERGAIVVALGVVVAVAAALHLRKSNFVPLFVLALFFSYLGVFTLLSRSFFHTRHLMSTQFWFVGVVGIGLAWIWEALRRLLPKHSTILTAAAAGVLALAVLNPFQVLLPTLSADPDMPISEDYMHDMSEVHDFMRSQAMPEDALIATVYGLYATWEREPAFDAQYRVNSKTTKEELEALIGQHASGWIVIDNIRLDLSPLSVRNITDISQIEYIGVFGDEHVWRWERTTGIPEGPRLEQRTWTFR